MSDPPITVRLPADLRQHLATQAAAEHRSQSAILIAALKEYLGRCDDEAFRRQAEQQCQLANAADARIDDWTEGFTDQVRDGWW